MALYINLPIGILAVIIAVFLLPGDESPRGNRPFDFAGFLLISPGVASILYALDHALRSEGKVFPITRVGLRELFASEACRGFWSIFRGVLGLD